MIQQPNQSTTTPGTSSYAVQRRAILSHLLGPTEQVTYLASGTKEECEALVNVFATQRAVFGWDESESATAPTDEVIPMAQVPSWARPAVLGSNAGEITRENLRSLPPYAEALARSGWADRRQRGEGVLLVLTA